MGDRDAARTSRPYGRRGVAARLLGVLAGLLVALLLAPSPALADDVIITSVGHGQENRVGQSVDVFATLSGTDCAGTTVTFSFVGGSEQKPISALDSGGGLCYATATLKIPKPDSCQGGQDQAQATFVAAITAGVVPQDMTVICPAAAPTKSPTPSSTPKPTKKPTSSPTPTLTVTPSGASSSASPPSSTAPASTVPASSPPTVSKPSKDQPTVARNAALLVPVDDGGPQPPDPDSGRSLPQQLAALLLLAVGGLATALIWQRGATRAVVGGVVAGTLVLASAPLIVPAVTSTDAPPSSAVRIRPVTAEQTVAAGATGSATVDCPAGSVLVGGGVRGGGAGAVGAVISVSVPTANGWTTSGTAPQGDAITLTAVALCTTDVGLTTAAAASVAASLAEGDTARTQARCSDGAPLALGWSGGGAPAVAALPLHDGATSIAWGTKDAATSLTNVLCTSAGSTAWPVRHDSEQVEIAAGSRGSASAPCGAGAQAVGGGYVAAASVGGRVAPVTIVAAAPEGDAFQVDVVAAGTGSGVLLTAYALCLPIH